jgi:hypothetical protein
MATAPRTYHVLLEACGFNGASAWSFEAGSYAASDISIAHDARLAAGVPAHHLLITSVPAPTEAKKRRNVRAAMRAPLPSSP